MTVKNSIHCKEEDGTKGINGANGARAILLRLFFIVLFLGISFVVFGTFAAAQDYSIVENPRPVITVTFDEPVDQPIASLRMDDSPVPISQVLPSDPGLKIFKYQPNIDLIDGGNYLFTIIAVDAGGKPGVEQQMYFQVQIPGLIINFNNPRLGVSPTETFDFSVKTDRVAASCNYSKTFEKLYGQMPDGFTTTDNIHFTLPGINIKEGEKLVYYVACIDSYGKITPPKKFELSVDTTKPNILTYAADPAVITYYKTDPVYGPNTLMTDLKVSTDDATLCRASQPSLNYLTMEKNFDGFNVSDRNAFLASSKKKLTDSADGINQMINYTFNVACENLAGLISDTKQINFSINLDEAFKISDVRPSKDIRTDKTTIDLTVMTNKESQCLYGNATDKIYLMPGDALEHTATIGKKGSKFVLKEGIQNIYVICAYGDSFAEATIKVIIDSTPPHLNDVYANITSENGSTIFRQWQTDRIFARIGASDEESGILMYNYSLFDSSNNQVLEWRTMSGGGSTELKLTSLNLSDGESYVLEVSAMNGAGLWSDDAESNEVQIDISLAPDDLFKCSNGFLDTVVGETDTDCGGWVCRQCAEGKKCEVSDDCGSGLDCVQNVCKSKQEACGAAKTIKCDAGKPCDVSDDCKSGVCGDYGTCEIATCFDEVQNEQETAVDCGGSKCDGCKKGMSCEVDSDCSTNLCKESDTEKICAGKELDETCTSDDECESDFCDKFENRCVKDSDNDGLPDYWEIKYYQNEFDGVSEEDTDNDGFTNKEEYDEGTDPTDPSSHKKITCSADSDCSANEGFVCDVRKLCVKDTDGNGLPDWWERKYFGCVNCVDPSADKDGDGLSNKDEYRHPNRPDPTKKDSDGDGYSDYAETQAGTDPTDETNHPVSNTGKIIAVVVILTALGGGGYAAYRFYLKDKIPEWFGKKAPLQEDVFGNYGGMQAPGVSGQQTTLEQRKSSAEQHKIFVERQKAKLEGRKSAFDAFGEEKATVKEKKQELESIGPVELKKGRLSEKKADKGKSLLYDRLSALSKKDIKAPSRMSRLDELSKRKSGGIEKLSKKSSSKDRLAEIGKSKKSSLSDLAKSKKRKGKGIEELRKKK